MVVETEKSEVLLDVNNIEVIYNHVILVLKGVSLAVPKGGIVALLEILKCEYCFQWRFLWSQKVKKRWLL
mgnify:CR=1 FL=1